MGDTKDDSVILPEGARKIAAAVRAKAASLREEEEEAEKIKEEEEKIKVEEEMEKSEPVKAEISKIHAKILEKSESERGERKIQHLLSNPDTTMQEAEYIGQRFKELGYRVTTRPRTPDSESLGVIDISW